MARLRPAGGPPAALGYVILGAVGSRPTHRPRIILQEETEKRLWFSLEVEGSAPSAPPCLTIDQSKFRS
jgi:hypothetical protein